MVGGKIFFKILVDLTLFDTSDPVQVGCLRFYFIELFREEVTEVAIAWKQHITSHHRNGGPTGRPDIMFFSPHTYDTIDHLQYVRDEDNDKFQGVLGQLPDGFSDDFREFAFFFSLIRRVLKCLPVH